MLRHLMLVASFCVVCGPSIAFAGPETPQKAAAPQQPAPPPFAATTPVDYPRDGSLADIRKWYRAIQEEEARKELAERGGHVVGISVGPSVTYLPEAEWLHLIDRVSQEMASPDAETAKVALQMASALQQTALSSPSLRAALGSKAFPAAVTRMKQLRTDEVRLAPPLVHVLAPYADPRESIPALIEASQSENADIRRAGVQGLQTIALEDRFPVPLSDAQRIAAADALFARADDADRMIRYMAISAIGFLRPPADPYLAKLTALTKSPDERTRAAAARALESYGPGASTQLPHFIEMLKSPNMKDRMNACKALRGMGAAAKDALPELMKNLECADPYVPEYALITIMTMGPAAELALPKLDELGTKPGDFGESCRKAASKIRKSMSK